MKRLKVLMSAYACEPDMGSEPGVGWNMAREMAKYHDIWVITRANNRPVIEAELANHPVDGLHFVYYDLPRWARFWKKGQRGLHLYYYLWQIRIYFRAKHLYKVVGFDLIHHVTFVNYWMPSFLSLLPVPFVWGPVGGGESAPSSFYSTFSLRGRLYECARSTVRWFFEQDPFVRRTAKKVSIAFATTPETAARLKRLGAKTVKILSEVALPKQEIRSLSKLPTHHDNPFRLLSLGRLLHWKGFHLSLMAFAQFLKEFPNSEYWVIGDGPERSNLLRLAKDLDIANKVIFWGSLPRSDVFRKLVECNVLVHPSLHDSGGWVCVEAMAAGRPVICMDLGGPTLQVTEETGFKIPAITPKQAVSDMSEVITKLANEKTLRDCMERAGRVRVWESFNYQKKGEHIVNTYAQVCSNVS